MFWKRKDGEKLPKPQDIPELVKKQLNPALIDPDIIQFLKLVAINNNKGEKARDFRIYDPAEAEAKGLVISSYNSLNGVDDMIIADGSFDEQTKNAVVNIKRNIPKYKLFSQDEICRQIEKLANTDEQVFFYIAAGGGSGGPLGRGAAVVKINPTDGKKRKKYGVYTSSVINMLPVLKKDDLIMDLDKPKEIAKWIAEAHKPRFC